MTDSLQIGRYDAQPSSPTGPRPDDDASTISCTSDSENEPPPVIKLSKCDSVVVWEDKEQRKHSTDLFLSLYTDCSKRRAFFKLYCSAYLSGYKGNNQRNLFLFIYPEHVESIEYEARNSSSVLNIQKRSSASLRFTMTQPPSFVIPRNRPLNPKSKSRPKVEAMQSLANVKCFTVYLNYLRLGLEIRDLLPLLPSIFASNHRLKRDERSADLQSLYDGTGGEVVDFGGLSSTCNTNTTLSGIATGVATDACVTAVTDVQEELPSYEAASSTGPREWTGFDRKRAYERGSLSPAAPKRILLDEHAERIRQLEKDVVELRNGEPCRYGPEEEQALLDHVDNRIEEDLENVKSAFDDSAEQLENRVWDKTDELVMERKDEMQELMAMREEIQSGKEELMAMREEIQAGKQELVVIKEQIEAGKQELLAMKNEMLPQITQLNDMVQKIAAALGANENPKTVLTN